MEKVTIEQAENGLILTAPARGKATGTETFVFTSLGKLMYFLRTHYGFK